MEEKILSILIEIQQDVKVLKEDVSGLKQDVSVLKEDVSGLKQDVSVLKEDVSGLKQDVSALKEDNKYIKGELAIMKNNIAKILEVQNNMNENFKKHERQARIKYKEIDYRLARLEA